MEIVFIFFLVLTISQYREMKKVVEYQKKGLTYRGYNSGDIIGGNGVLVIGISGTIALFSDIIANFFSKIYYISFIISLILTFIQLKEIYKIRIYQKKEKQYKSFFEGEVVGNYMLLEILVILDYFFYMRM